MNSTKKINVFFNEYNLLMGSGGSTYLPLVSGILAANAKRINKIKENFEFNKFVFLPDTAENIIKNYYKEIPHMATFSISMWNEQLSLKVAKILKEKYNTLIIFGGASCPHKPTEYFKKYPFIDIAVRAEGEDSFNALLLRYIDDKNDFSKIANIAFRDKKTNKCIINYEKSNFDKDLDVYPSPYLTGEFEYLVPEDQEHNYQAIIETNRGCPFLCTYCYWGKGGNSTKYRFHSLERVFAEIDWFAKKKIDHIFNADSNFGMHRRDTQIAEKLIDSKVRTGYPHKFRTCWGKNTSEQIFKIANMFHAYDLSKGITLGRQTNSEEALKNVKRDNIKLEAYTDLERKFNNLRVPIYAEMILGLPGETCKSWIDGLGTLLDSYVNNQILIYPAEVYPNTELNDEDYRKKYGVITKKIELNERNSSPKKMEWLQEYQEIVVGTYTMNQKDWKKMNLFSIVLMVIHSFKVGFYVMNYLKDEMQISCKDFLEFICNNIDKKKYPFIYKCIPERINNWTNDILAGKSVANFNIKYSDMNLDIEAIIFLDISQDFETFYKELKDLVKDLVGTKNWKKNSEIIDEIFLYQDLRMPRVNMDNKKINFNYNIAEYMFSFGTSKQVKLKKCKNLIQTVNTTNYGTNCWEFTKRKIIWARKEDKIKNEIDYDNQILEEMKKIEMEKAKLNDKTNLESKYKINIFDKKNKFQKYDSLETKKGNISVN